MLNIEVEETRIQKMVDYLLPIVNELLMQETNLINANMLSKNINNFSLDKIPTDPEVENWIIGIARKKDIYSLRSRNEYSTDQINNLKNIGFFEKFESIIDSNNSEGKLPNIDNIESIECLNCGSVVNTNNNTCEMDIQIQITYRE